MKILKITMTLLLGCLAWQQVKAEDSDLLNAALSKQGCAEEVPSGYYKLSEVLATPYDGGALLKLPKKGEGVFNKIVTQAINVKPSTRYVIDWEIMTQQFLQLLIFAEYKNPRNGYDPLNVVMSIGSSNHSAFMRLEKEIITPPDATELKLHIFLSQSQSTYVTPLKPDTTLGFVRSFKIREIDTVQLAPELKDLAGKNILPLGNFESLEVGEKDRGKLALGPVGLPKPFEAEVVKDETGRKVLRVKYKPGDHPYVSFYSPGTMKLYGSSGIMKCRIRGKGKVQLMVFWGRNKFHTIFRHFGFFELTPEWKEYSVGIGCDDPLTIKVAACIACRDKEAEFEISDISYTLNNSK